MLLLLALPTMLHQHELGLFAEEIRLYSLMQDLVQCVGQQVDHTSLKYVALLGTLGKGPLLDLHF